MIEGFLSATYPFRLELVDEAGVATTLLCQDLTESLAKEADANVSDGNDPDRFNGNLGFTIPHLPLYIPFVLTST